MDGEVSEGVPDGVEVFLHALEDTESAGDRKASGSTLPSSSRSVVDDDAPKERSDPTADPAASAEGDYRGSCSARTRTTASHGLIPRAYDGGRRSELLAVAHREAELGPEVSAVGLQVRRSAEDCGVLGCAAQIVEETTEFGVG